MSQFKTLALFLGALAIAPPALAQDTTVTSGSTSGANSGSTSAAVNGPVTVGPIDASSRTTSDSNSNAVSGSNSASYSQGGSSTAGANSSAVTGPSSSTSTANTGASTSGAEQSQTADNNGNAQSITFNTTNPDTLKTVPQVYAPALSTTLTETCMGSTSGGVSVLGFGGTLGTTWNDGQCVRRLNAREMAQTLGDREAARALLCQDKDVAAAYAAVGQSCAVPVAQPKVAAVSAPIPVPASTPPPVVVPPPPVTMQPIPNPPDPDHDGERGGRD